jgi:hypothetical protein
MKLKTPCETASKYLLPSIRALIAKKLIENYKFTQQNAALRLGMTQSAMSKYLSEKRGAVIVAHKEIDELAEGVARKISEGKMTQEEFVEQLCIICMKYRNDESICKKR